MEAKTLKEVTESKQRIPRLFCQIMVNHAEIAAVKSAKLISFPYIKNLMMIRKDYRRAAEEFLQRK